MMSKFPEFLSRFIQYRMSIHTENSPRRYSYKDTAEAWDELRKVFGNHEQKVSGTLSSESIRVKTMAILSPFRNDEERRDAIVDKSAVTLERRFQYDAELQVRRKQVSVSGS